MEFKKYRQRVPTRARVLTQEDYERRQGVVQTLEGPRTFQPGDYLAKDTLGEWPIEQAALQNAYKQVAAEDEEGYAAYLSIASRLAAPMPEPFTIQGLSGKAGDYLVISGDCGWPVAREIFEQTYALDESDV